MKTKYVYAIYPKDKDGNIAGVYVGSSENVERRIRSHTNRHRNDTQYELHFLMRKNGFEFEVLDSINCPDEMYKEYMWIELLCKNYPKVFNKYVGNEYPGKAEGIGNSINVYLQQNHIQVYELARATKIKPLKLLKILSCRVSLDVIEYYKICKALQLPLNYFLEGVIA